MTPGKFLSSLLVITICSAGGFGLMRWMQAAPATVAAAAAAAAAAASGSASPMVVNRLSGCQGFNQSIDEEIMRQNRIGHTHNSARLATLKRDCTVDDQEHYRVLQR